MQVGLEGPGQRPWGRRAEMRSKNRREPGAWGSNFKKPRVHGTTAAHLLSGLLCCPPCLCHCGLISLLPQCPALFCPWTSADAAPSTQGGFVTCSSGQPDIIPASCFTDKGSSGQLHQALKPPEQASLVEALHQVVWSVPPNAHLRAGSSVLSLVEVIGLFSVS